MDEFGHKSRTDLNTECSSQLELGVEVDDGVGDVWETSELVAFAAWEGAKE